MVKLRSLRVSEFLLPFVCTCGRIDHCDDDFSDTREAIVAVVDKEGGIPGSDERGGKSGNSGGCDAGRFGDCEGGKVVDIRLVAAEEGPEWLTITIRRLRSAWSLHSPF